MGLYAYVSNFFSKPVLTMDQLIQSHFKNTGFDQTITPQKRDLIPLQILDKHLANQVESLIKRMQMLSKELSRGADEINVDAKIKKIDEDLETLKISMKPFLEPDANLDEKMEEALDKLQRQSNGLLTQKGQLEALQSEYKKIEEQIEAYQQERKNLFTDARRVLGILEEPNTLATLVDKDLSGKKQFSETLTEDEGQLAQLYIEDRECEHKIKKLLLELLDVDSPTFSDKFKELQHLREVRESLLSEGRELLDEINQQNVSVSRP